MFATDNNSATCRARCTSNLLRNVWPQWVFDRQGTGKPLKVFGFFSQAVRWLLAITETFPPCLSSWRWNTHTQLTSGCCLFTSRQVACEWQKARIAQTFPHHCVCLTFLRTDDNGMAVGLRRADWSVIDPLAPNVIFAFWFFGKTRKKKLTFQNMSSITPIGMSLCLYYSLDLQYFSHQLFGWILFMLISWLESN